MLGYIQSYVFFHLCDPQDHDGVNDLGQDQRHHVNYSPPPRLWPPGRLCHRSPFPERWAFLSASWRKPSQRPSSRRGVGHQQDGSSKAIGPLELSWRAVDQGSPEKGQHDEGSETNAFCHCGGEDSERHDSEDKLEGHVD